MHEVKFILIENMKKNSKLSKKNLMGGFIIKYYSPIHFTIHSAKKFIFTIKK